MDINGAWSAIAHNANNTSSNSGTGTSKVAASCSFLVDSPILY